MIKNIILTVIIIILTGAVGYFVLIRKASPFEFSIFSSTSNKISEFGGYTDAEQQKPCGSYFGTFNGEEIPSELAKEIVGVAEDSLKNKVGSEFFKIHYQYECASGLRSIERELPGVILVPFRIKIINKNLEIDTTEADTKIQPTRIQVGIDKSTLQAVTWDYLLTEDSLLSQKWLPQKDVLGALRPQLPEEIEQKINSLKPDEISIEISLEENSEYSKLIGSHSPPELRLFWTVVLGKWNSDFCKYYRLSASDGRMVYRQSCSSEGPIDQWSLPSSN
ncbi:MAG: hypothetical protein V1711_01510 [bacterium]